MLDFLSNTIYFVIAKGAKIILWGTESYANAILYTLPRPNLFH